MQVLEAVPPQLAPYVARGASRELAALMLQWETLLHAKGVPFLVYTVYRTPDEQARLYAQGRTAPGHIVTYAKPGQSAHNRQVEGQPAADAFDACPMVHGKPTWETSGEALLFWNVMGSCAESIGLEWGRHYSHLGGDWAHFELNRSNQHCERAAA